MIWPDINNRLADMFENATLPTLVYVNKQDHERIKVLRPLHSHDSICELLVVCNGTGTYQLGSETYPINQGSVVLANQGDLHEVTSSLDTEVGDYCIGISNLRLNGMNRNQLITEPDTCVRNAGDLFPTLVTICEQMFNLRTEKDNNSQNLACQLLLTSIIVLSLSLPAANEKPLSSHSDEQFVSRIKNYLNAHFTQDISLDDIAQALSCSSTYVSHMFKDITGITPFQYVIQRRIGLAQTLIISTDMSITQIASMVGYDNSNYFTTLFSKVIGISPGKYRTFYLDELRGIRDQL